MKETEAWTTDLEQARREALERLCTALELPSPDDAQLMRMADFFNEAGMLRHTPRSGYAFLEVDGAVEEKVLGAGEQLVVDSGYVAAMEQSVSMDIEMVKGLGNIAFGGEGLFNTILTGPGRVWLQTMPISALANSLAPLIAANNGK